MVLIIAPALFIVGGYSKIMNLREIFKSPQFVSCFKSLHRKGRDHISVIARIVCCLMMVLSLLCHFHPKHLNVVLSPPSALAEKALKFLEYELVRATSMNREVSPDLGYFDIPHIQRNELSCFIRTFLQGRLQAVNHMRDPRCSSEGRAVKCNQTSV